MIDYSYKQDRIFLRERMLARDVGAFEVNGRLTPHCLQSFMGAVRGPGRSDRSMPSKPRLILSGKESGTGLHIAHFSRWPRGLARGDLK